jgi:hypothetical protein
VSDFTNQPHGDVHGTTLDRPEASLCHTKLGSHLPLVDCLVVRMARKLIASTWAGWIADFGILTQGETATETFIS